MGEKDLFYDPKEYASLDHTMYEGVNSRLYLMMHDAYPGKITKEARKALSIRIDYLIFNITVHAGIICNKQGRQTINSDDIKLATTVVIQKEAKKRLKPDI